MIYLASLYSNGAGSDSFIDYEIRQGRYEYTMKRVAEFMNSGDFVFSPITHCHQVSVQYGLPKDYSFWKSNDRHFVSKSDEVWVLCMEDIYGSWEKSVGISDEINFAIDNNIPVKYIDCSDYKLEV